MKKNFLILADLDSTFEEWEKDKNEFDGFLSFVEEFEKNLDCFIVIHFISGTSIEDFAERMDFFKYEYPEIYSRIDYAVLANGKKYSRDLKIIGKCDTHHEGYNKADGVHEVESSYSRAQIAGVCFLGDGINDIPAFDMVGFFKRKYPYGGYALAPRSRRNYYEIKDHIDYYSEQPRILGCIDCLKKMEQDIKSKIKDTDENSI